MSHNSYTEDQLVEQPAIGFFTVSGWQTGSDLDEVLGMNGTLARVDERRRLSLEVVKRWFSVNAEKAGSCEFPVLQGDSGLIASLMDGCGNLLFYIIFLFVSKTSL